jgi:Spy/CpxP family protein refolding chaperone
MVMKTRILNLMMAALLATGLMFAQQGGGKRGDRMAELLGLTEDQKPQVQSILQQEREAIQAARKNNATRDEIKSIHEKFRQQLAGVLTPDQMAKWDKAAKRIKDRRKPRG